jgi:hypothetical protein
MLSDPAWRSLIARTARRVCRAVKAHRSCDTVRGCAVLATDSQKLTFSCRSPYSHAIRSDGHTLSTQHPLTDSNHCTRRLRGWSPGSGPNILCTCYTIRRLPFATDGRMIAPYQSLRDVPFRLYGSLRAVKVLRAALWSTVDRACSACYVELHISGEMLRTQKCGVGRKSARFTAFSANQLHIYDEELSAVPSTTGGN